MSLVALIGFQLPRLAVAEEWSFLMYSDPKLTVYKSPGEIPHEALVSWERSLRHPGDTELLAVTAFDIVKAKRVDAIDLTPLTPLIRELFQNTESDVVRLSMARTLIELGDRDFAKDLADAADDDLNLSAWVEPALAEWNYEPRYSMWRERVSNANFTRRERLIAIKSLAAVKDPLAAKDLLDVVRDSTEATALRMAAAEAFAHCGEKEDDPIVMAESLGDGPMGKLLAVRLLSRATQEASMPVLKRFAVDPNLGVAPIACARLANRWPQELVKLCETLQSHPSSKARQITVECVGEHGGEAAPQLLGPFLPDRHPDVRAAAGAELVRIGKEGALLEAVQEQVRIALQGEAWQGHCQGARVADELGYVDASPLAMKLLESADQRTRDAAAYFLGRHLPAEDMEGVLVHVKDILENRVPNGANPVPRDNEMLLLMQAFGRTKYLPADPVLRPFVPKNAPYAPALRVGAIWALGKTYQDKAPKDLGEMFAERLSDLGMMPEYTSVRAMSAVGLGWMNSKDQLQTLRRFPVGKTGIVGVSLIWAIERITGVAPKAPRPWRRVILNFHVFPLLSDFEP